MLHDEADDIATLAAREALEDVLRVVKMKRRRMVVVKETETTAVVLACAIELDAEFLGDGDNGNGADIVFGNFREFHKRLLLVPCEG